ncbi:putative choline kinase 2 [Dichanthelium oligosanthes]|uniref:Putative choline kinase 2 n=1 Tax=Dichanthelium oligosanthes TaxID=888268 RepID=A0A1E5UT21_9POAL|nr:putative choline kinase 2 [Dichanthelium oligosanthes]
MAPNESQQSPAPAPAPAERGIPEEARRLLRELAAAWEDDVAAGCGREPEVVPLKGAMTNEVYQARWPTGGEEREERRVLVRVYGEGVELFFDREDEVRTFECMSRHGHGPRLLGRFRNGRVEEFIHAREESSCKYSFQTLSAADLLAYDIANHFCEMAADYHSEEPHILDYTKYPDANERKQFVQTYLSSSGEESEAEEVENLIKSIEKYTLASHLVWCLWGIISDHVNDIDFDYKEYARQRLEQYRLKKPAILTSQIAE